MVALFLFLKGMMRALVPFSYLVIYILLFQQTHCRFNTPIIFSQTALFINS